MAKWTPERAYVHLSRRDFLIGGAAAAGAMLTASAGWTSSPILRDSFGGLRSMTLTLGDARRFRIKKLDDRWIFVTPANHPYWMLGVFNVDTSTAAFSPGCSYRSEIMAKYGSEAVWARQAARRMRAWEFNCLAEYASDYTLPVPLYGRPGNHVRLPFAAMIRPAAFSLTNRWRYASQPVNDIVAATDPAVYRGWRGDTTPDVFDPNFAAYARGEAAALAQRFGDSEYLVGVTTDDSDDLFGFGPGPEVAAARTHPHLGWMTLVANFAPSLHAPAISPAAAPRLFGKYALTAWLQKRYGTITALNQAWRARYTGFGSDGGWPHGRGLLDESGRSPWVGQDPYRLSPASPALRSDLNEFLYLHARTYFQAVSGAVRQAFPDNLVFGPATLNSWNGLTRRPILLAAGAALDVLQANVASPEVLRATVASAGDLPIVTWTGIAANRDSDLYAFPSPDSGSPLCASQLDRGQFYAQAVLAEASASVAGVHPIAGTKFWAFADSWAEKMNWGLVSFRDNAYDGHEALRRRGRDAWGYATGGEQRDFGDCLSGIKAAHTTLLSRLDAELKAPSAPGPAARGRRWPS